MPNFQAEIRTLLNDAAHWTILDPPFSEVEFPYAISQDYLVASHRIGKSMVWVVERRGTLGEIQPLGASTIHGDIGIFCYSRAKSNKAADVEDASNKMMNMFDQAAQIIKAHWKTIPGILDAHCVGTEPLTEEIDPKYFVKVLTVLAKYEI